MSPTSIEYDPRAGAVYVRFSELPVAKSIEEEDCVVDHAADDSIIGIEILDLSTLSAVAERFDFTDALIHQDISDDDPPASTTTISSSWMQFAKADTDAASVSRPALPVRELEIA